MDFEQTPEGDRGSRARRHHPGRSTAPPSGSGRSTPRPARFDHELWRRFADSGLIALTVPEEHDGSGLGLLELCSVLVEVGRTVAPGAARRRTP